MSWLQTISLLLTLVDSIKDTSSNNLLDFCCRLVCCVRAGSNWSLLKFLYGQFLTTRYFCTSNWLIGKQQIVFSFVRLVIKSSFGTNFTHFQYKKKPTMASTLDDKYETVDCSVDNGTGRNVQKRSHKQVSEIARTRLAAKATYRGL